MNTTSERPAVQTAAKKPLVRNHDAAPPSANAALPAASVLAEAIEDMGALSLEGFASVRAIIYLVVREIQQPDPCLGYVRDVLRVASDKCDDIQELITGTAENVGCHRMDYSWGMPIVPHAERSEARS